MYISLIVSLDSSLFILSFFFTYSGLFLLLSIRVYVSQSNRVSWYHSIHFVVFFFRLLISIRPYYCYSICLSHSNDFEFNLSVQISSISNSDCKFPMSTTTENKYYILFTINSLDINKIQLNFIESYKRGVARNPSLVELNRVCQPQDRLVKQ